MIIKNVTSQEIRQALEQVTAKYEGNITFKRFEPYRKGYRVTLRIKDSKGKGAKVGYTGRRSISACWHTFGHFFEALLNINNKAVIISSKSTIDKEGGNWQDFNIGSIISPLSASRACECYNKNIREILRKRR